MFFRDCENYIVSIFYNNFQTNEKKIRWFFTFLIDVKKQIWIFFRNALLRDIEKFI